MTIEYLEAAGYRVTGLNVSRQALELLDNGRRRLVLADLSQPIPSHTGTFDAVLALDVIEHIDDDQGAVERLMSLAAPGGVPDRHLFQHSWSSSRSSTQFKGIDGGTNLVTLARAFHTSGMEPQQVLWWGASMVHILRRQRRRPLGKKEESPSAIYKRYLKLPPWPGRLALDWLLRHEVGRTPRGQSKIGSSLVAIVTRPAAPAPHVATRPPDDRDLGDPRTTGALHWRWRSSASPMAAIRRGPFNWPAHSPSISTGGVSLQGAFGRLPGTSGERSSARRRFGKVPSSRSSSVSCTRIWPRPESVLVFNVLCVGLATFLLAYASLRLGAPPVAVVPALLAWIVYPPRSVPSTVTTWPNPSSRSPAPRRSFVLFLRANRRGHLAAISS